MLDSGFELKVVTDGNDYEFSMFYGPDKFFDRPPGANNAFSVFLNLAEIHNGKD